MVTGEVQSQKSEVPDMPALRLWFWFSLTHHLVAELGQYLLLTGDGVLLSLDALLQLSEQLVKLSRRKAD